MVLLKNVTEVVHSRGYTRIRILAGSLLPYCFPEINRIYAIIKYIQYHMSEPIVTHRKGGLVVLHAAVSEVFQFNTFLCLFTSHQRRSRTLCQPGAKSFWHWFLYSSFMWGGCGDLLVETLWQTLKKWVQPWAQIPFSPLPFPCAWLKCKGVPGHWGVRWWLPLNFPCTLLASETALGFLTVCLGSVKPLTLVLCSTFFRKCSVASNSPGVPLASLIFL